MIYAKGHTSVKGGAEYAALLKKIGQLAKSYVTIGLHEDAGSYPGGQTVVEVGMWNEFGTETSPERSWMRSTIDENEGLLNQWREEMFYNIVDKGWPVQKSLEAIGMRIVVLLQNKIKSNVPPAYGTGKSGADAVEIAKRQASKEARDGHSETLRDTELMLRSITYKVVIVD